ncbi:hypothetical protein [Herbaspirillum sp. VT-16-41]|uniref:hypothetical protein n=1 Tax=Herbaspirillum sp. VT-16-41 TaxID=1953765 RepID=UPI000981F67F|nr:hypothetical protein [Herbaspirillum sp. VT-16-41]ONN64819.1 hypothetical protein BTM36_22215 [Herbaspirillum sp. VT-16-41]
MATDFIQAALKKIRVAEAAVVKPANAHKARRAAAKERFVAENCTMLDAIHQLCREFSANLRQDNYSVSTKDDVSFSDQDDVSFSDQDDVASWTKTIVIASSRLLGGFSTVEESGSAPRMYTINLVWLSSELELFVISTSNPPNVEGKIVMPLPEKITIELTDSATSKIAEFLIDVVAHDKTYY